MAEYAKKTVAELQEILKSRGLPSSGKKAELITRLNENDKEASAAEEASIVPEQEPEVATEPAQATTSTTAEAEPAPESDSTTLQPPADPTSTATDNPSPDTTLADQANYSLNLPTSSLDSELAKRKARAERFGISAAAPAADSTAAENSTEQTTATDTDALALKNLERAKRFGTGQTAIGKLDEALPSDMARGRKRGHGAVAEGTDLDDPGLKRNFANRGRGGRGGRSSRGGGRGDSRNGGRGGQPQGARPQGVQKAPPAYTSEKDKMAADARKKKFATA